MSNVLVAAISAAVMLDDVPHVIEAGRTLARDTHPIVTTNPDLWGPLVVQYDVPEPEETPAPVAKRGGKPATS